MTSLTFVSLFLLTILSTASAQGGIASCCRKVSKTQIHREQLMSYYVQHKTSCPLRAVVFTTMTGRRICSDPERLWTKTSTAFLDGKNYTRQRALNGH
ncbi:monocyte chemotactic protein 1B-like [Scomber japonicus]|uniref:monocyte chemotactic protein 1B-like n=1 Tax=Scomber japonicus TaxID=13676 RepID=UPI0023065C77|nr:monocyte chemotactic protein 1B-like [Scomber japonicus]